MKLLFLLTLCLVLALVQSISDCNPSDCKLPDCKCSEEPKGNDGHSPQVNE